MKFTCERDVIIKEISVAQEIISSRNSLSILSNVYLQAQDDTLLIRATDLKVAFETRIPVEVKVPGSTTVYCDKLLGILRSLPAGHVEFEDLDDRFVIKPIFKKIDFRLKSIPADKYPEEQHVDESLFIQIPQKDFIEMITQTVFAVSDDETRYFMNGVYMEKQGNLIKMVATDGRRLSYIAKEIGVPGQDFKGVIVPPKSLNLLKKQASGEGLLSVAITEKQIFFRFDNQKLSSSLIEGQFPNYQRVIPENQLHHFVVDRHELNEALKRVALLVEKSHRVYLYLENGSLRLESEENDIGKASEEVNCEYEGPSGRIALNLQYMIEPLKFIEEDKIDIHYTEVNKAMTIYSLPKGDYFHIVMPMQID